jgi:hypothetical protein
LLQGFQLKSKTVAKKTSKPNNQMTISSTIQLTSLIQEQLLEISSKDTTTRLDYATSALNLDEVSTAMSTIPKSASTIDSSSFDFSTSTKAVRLKKIQFLFCPFYKIYNNLLIYRLF